MRKTRWGCFVSLETYGKEVSHGGGAASSLDSQTRGSEARDSPGGTWVRGFSPAVVFSAQDSHREGTWHLCDLQKHHTQNTWRAWEMPWSCVGAKQRDDPTAGPSLGPNLGENPETRLFFLGPALLFFSSMLVWGWGWFLLKYLVLPNLVINWMLQKECWVFLFCIFPTQSQGCAPSV